MNKFIPRLFASFFIGGASWVMAESGATPVYQLADVQGTFIQVPLTHDIYRYARHADLHDLKVLDAEHNALPYQLVTLIPTPEKSDPKIITDALAFFPVAVDATPDTLRQLHTSQTRIRGDKVQVATSDKVLDNKTPEFYLIDISKIDHAITSINIEWAAQPDNQYLEVELEATNNLQDWFSLGHATLVQISQQDQQLKHNQIAVDISKKEYDFLRLKILRGADQLNIIRMESQQKISPLADIPDTSESWSIGGQPAKIQTSVYFAHSRAKTQTVSAWEFTRDEVTPVETLSVDMGSTIYGDGIKVFSRTAENKDWQLLYQGIWFNAQVGEKWQTSEPLKIYQNHDKFWRLEFTESAKNYSPPKIIFSWQPTHLQIITNNKPPFSIAIGREANASSNQQVFNQIVSAASPKWMSANLIKLAVQPEAIITETGKVEWRQWIFWGALVAAVVVLLMFSLKLFKQLKMTDVSK